MGYILREDKLKTFLENRECPLDSIFSQIDEMIGDSKTSTNIIQESDNAVMAQPANMEEIQRYIAKLAADKKAGKQLTDSQELLLKKYAEWLKLPQTIGADYKSGVAEGKALGKRLATQKYTPEQATQEYKRQLAINQRLQGEIQRNTSIAQDRTQCVQAFQNQDAYNRQVQVSRAVVPRELRAKEKGSSFGFGGIMGLLGQFQGFVYMAMFATMTLPSLFGETGLKMLETAWSPIRFLWNSITSPFIGGQGHIDNAGYTAEGEDLANQLEATKKSYEQTSMLTKGDVTSAQTSVFDNLMAKNDDGTYKIALGVDEAKRTQIANAAKSANTLAEFDKTIADANLSTADQKTLSGETLGLRKALDKNDHAGDTVANIQKRLAENGGHKNTQFGLNWYTFSKGIMWAFWIYIAYVVISKIYKWWTKDTEKKRQEELRQTQGVVQQESLMPYYTNDDIVYFRQMRLINEAIESGPKTPKLNFGTKSLLNMSNKTIVGLNGLSKTIEYGIKTKTISPVKAKVGNILLGYTNSKIIPARGSVIAGVASK